MRDPVFIRLESPETIKNTRLGSLQGSHLQKEIRNKLRLIRSLIDGEHKDLLDTQGFMLLVNGSWGVGKTTVANALINQLKDACPGSLVDIRTDSFLPFGNVNESIGNFLNTLAYELWNQNIIDIRKEIRPFVLEATTDYEINNQMSISAGPFSVSRTWSKNRSLTGQRRINQRFEILVKKRKTVVLVVDDIDRLAPNEMLAVLRMVEKVRRLPRVIVIVPVFKDAMARGLIEELKLTGMSAANNFLRKLTDSEISLSYGVGDFKQVFMNEFQKQEGIEVGQSHLSLAEYCWYILLHQLIIYEALSGVGQTQSDTDVRKSIEEIYNRSAYITALVDKINKSRQDDEYYPVHTMRGKEHNLSRLSELYPYLGGPPRQAFFYDLEQLTKPERVFRNILLNREAHEALASTRSAAWDDKYKIGSKNPFFDIIAIPLLKRTKHESSLTDNYSMRDIKVVAREIQQHRDFKISNLSPQFLYNIIGKIVKNFTLD